MVTTHNETNSTLPATQVTQERRLRSPIATGKRHYTYLFSELNVTHAPPQVRGAPQSTNRACNLDIFLM